MENRVSSYEERQLTNAIERAATVCSVNEDLDRNATLVQQLKKASVDPKFAKTASQAFNKRLTVLTFKKTADEHKADTFELSDPDVVYKMMAGGEELQKAASFSMTTEDLTEGGMDKAASEKVPVANRYESRVGMDTFQRHLDSLMDKYASVFRTLASDVENLENAVEKDAQEVADYFKKASYDFDFTTAVNIYGEDLKAAIGDKVDDGVSFEKTASFVVHPKKEIFKKVAKLIEDREELEGLKRYVGYFANGLAEFCKTASDFGEMWLKKQADLSPFIDSATAEMRAYDPQLAAARRAIERDAYSGAMALRLGGALDIGLGTLAAGAEAGLNGFKSIAGGVNRAWQNAMIKNYMGNRPSFAPGDLVDSKFLVNDRYLDRLMAWSDMSADPLLSQYPADQVFAATQKVMDTNTAMERPDNRELLRAQVAQTLAQNNRLSIADIAAQSSTLKDIKDTQDTLAVDAGRAVSALGEKTAPERPEQQSVLELIDTTGLHDLSEAAAKDLEEKRKALDAISERKRKLHEEQYKSLASGKSDAKKRLDSLVSAQEGREYTEKQREEQRDEQRDYAEKQKTLNDAEAEKKRIAIRDEQRKYQEDQEKQRENKRKAEEAARDAKKQKEEAQRKADEAKRRAKEDAAAKQKDRDAIIEKIVAELRRKNGLNGIPQQTSNGTVYFDGPSGSKVPLDLLYAHAEDLYNHNYRGEYSGRKRKGNR